VTNLFKKIIGVSVNPEEQKVLDAINESGLQTMRVVGRGSLTVDSKEVTNTAKFKTYVEQARSIVEENG